MQDERRNEGRCGGRVKSYNATSETSQGVAGSTQMKKSTNCSDVTLEADLAAGKPVRAGKAPPVLPVPSQEVQAIRMFEQMSSDVIGSSCSLVASPLSFPSARALLHCQPSALPLIAAISQRPIVKPPPISRYSSTPTPQLSTFTRLLLPWNAN